MRPHPGFLKPLAIAFAALLASSGALAADVTFTYTSLAPSGGVGVAPLWIGLQNGGYTVFSPGQTASAGLEQAAEDGSSAGLTSAFAAANPTGVQGTLVGAPAFSGDVRSLTLHNVDLGAANRYLSYAGMVVVSSDYFLGNTSAIDLSSLALGGSMTLMLGGAGGVYDAGTEINDFNYSVANGAFGFGGGQSVPGQGNAENGVIHVVTGNPYASFLGQDLVPANYDWTALNFNQQPAFGSLTISVSAVPEPAEAALLLAGLGAMGLVLRRRR